MRYRGGAFAHAASLLGLASLLSVSAQFLVLWPLKVSLPRGHIPDHGTPLGSPGSTALPRACHSRGFTVGVVR